MKIGSRIYTLERLILNREGVDRERRSASETNGGASSRRDRQGKIYHSGDVCRNARGILSDSRVGMKADVLFPKRFPDLRSPETYRKGSAFEDFFRFAAI